MMDDGLAGGQLTEKSFINRELISTARRTGIKDSTPDFVILKPVDLLQTFRIYPSERCMIQRTFIG
jgi:hypothetical protein